MSEKTSSQEAVSHNQAMLSGPNLNNKITSALLQYRFDKYFLCFDLSKAFLSIGIRPIDQYKLLLIWFRNVKEEDYELVVYKNLRLAFGLRPSPTLLMCGLYRILVMDVTTDEENLRHLN